MTTTSNHEPTAGRNPHDCVIYYNGPRGYHVVIYGDTVMLETGECLPEVERTFAQRRNLERFLVALGFRLEDLTMRDQSNGERLTRRIRFMGEKHSTAK